MKARSIISFRCFLLVTIICLMINRNALGQTTSDQNILSTYTDTMLINFDDAEKMFMGKNYELLAQKYNVESQRALYLQAKLLNNPNLYYEASLYNTYSHKFFQIQKGEQGFNGGINNPASQGSYTWNFSQVLSLANKRLKNAALAGTNVVKSEYEFLDLIRNLRYQLRQDFVELYFLQKTNNLYDIEISSIDEVINAYDLQFNKGNIPLLEIQRLKAFQISLASERRKLLSQLIDRQNNLMILLATQGFPYFKPLINITAIEKLQFSKLPILTLVDSAEIYRYDLKASEIQLVADKQNISLQKAIAVPDVTLGANHVSNGNYVPNYSGVNMAIGLPAFNRNQGNIKSAKYRLQSDSAYYKSVKNQLEKDVWHAVTQLIQTDIQYQKFDKNFISNYEKLLEGVRLNYAKKNISTIEFVDFYESYKNSVVQNNELQSDRLSNIENLNFIIGKTIFKY